MKTKDLINMGTVNKEVQSNIFIFVFIHLFVCVFMHLLRKAFCNISL